MIMYFIFSFITVSLALSSVLQEEIHSCSKNQFQCRDGTCIPFDEKCDGVVDCPDSSDETNALCTTTMHSRFLRETLWPSSENANSNTGDCVLPAYPEHGSYLTDIANWKLGDAYDAVTLNVNCNTGYSVVGSNLIYCRNGRWNENSIPKCAKMCKLQPHPSVQYACVDTGAVGGFRACDEFEPHGTTVIPQCRTPNYYYPTTDLTDMACFEGNWNYILLCNPVDLSTVSNEERNSSRPPKPGDCVLPPYPEHGSYVTNILNGKPGDAYDAVTLNVTCNIGYGVVGSNSIYCLSGWWPDSTIPKCVRLCKLQPHPSVEYTCLVTGAVIGYRDCNKFEPHGTTVSPQCRKPNYYSPTTLTHMRCVEGNWDYIPLCNPECGRVIPKGVIGRHPAEKGEVPWHAGIYRKTTNPYTQICGGSLISNTIVISAAHCFWTDVDKALPAPNFAVAVGKIYRPWNNKVDESQKSEVSEIRLPSRFQGASANFQEDIAIVIVTTAFEYKYFVRPVCVDFDVDFERRQLQPGKIGKVAGWGLPAENGVASPVLKVLDVLYINIDTCINETPPWFKEYITSDKICAGYRNGSSAICKGDSGGGLAFPESDKGIERYYLRGIMSTAPNNENFCNVNTYTSFTQLIKHEHFVKEYWTDS